MKCMPLSCTSYLSTDDIVEVDELRNLTKPSQYLPRSWPICHTADINMTDDKKQRYLMHSVKEQFFTRLVRDPPSTAADLIKEATAIERALHQRCRLYDRLSSSNPVNAAAMTVNTRSSTSSKRLFAKKFRSSRL